MTPARRDAIRAAAITDIYAGWGDDRMYHAEWTPREILYLLDAAEEMEHLRGALRRIRDAAEAGATHEHLLGVIAAEDAQGMIEEAKP